MSHKIIPNAKNASLSFKICNRQIRMEGAKVNCTMNIKINK